MVVGGVEFRRSFLGEAMRGRPISGSSLRRASSASFIIGNCHALSPVRLLPVQAGFPWS
jgi:hypothetical protein